MKTILFSLLLCLGASLKGQDIPHHFNETDSPIFTINEIGPPNFVIMDECKPAQTIKTASDRLLAICIDGKFEPWMGLAPKPPMDVPAIQEKPYWTKPKYTDPPEVKGYSEGCKEAGLLWSPTKGCRHIFYTCPDPHNYALLTSVDGEIHTCHRISQ